MTNYTQREFDELVDAVLAADNSDDLPIFTWARAAKVFLARLAHIADLMAEDCNCVLPEQSCPACRAAAREVYDLES